MKGGGLNWVMYYVIKMSFFLVRPVLGVFLFEKGRKPSLRLYFPIHINTFKRGSFFFSKRFIFVSSEH